MLANPKIASRVAELRAPAMNAVKLEIEETLRQLACVLRSDPLELDEKRRPKKIRLCNKTDAIDKAMRHLGLFERDNREQRKNLAIQVNLVGAPPPSDVQAKRGALRN